MKETFAVRGQLAIAGRLAEGAVIVRDGRIAAIERSIRDGDLPEQVIDAPIVAPGFVDLQVNGGFGVEVDDDPESYRLLARRLPESGVTSYLPTVISSLQPVYAPAFAAFESVRGATGAVALGFHLEGPFLSPARKGAHPIEAIDGATDELFEEMTRFGGTLLVTLASERPGGLDRIARLRERGIVASLGHTNATAAEFTAGVDAGATMATHLYNAMSPFGHREPGVIGAVLTEDRVVAGLIVDGVHSHPRSVALATRAKGIDRIALVTDMMAAAGMPAGAYTLGGREVRTDGVSATLPDGTLAGAVLLMDEAIRNVVRWGGVTIAEAIRMATEVPAAVLGRSEIGTLKFGARADLALLDRAIQVTKTFVAGTPVFER